MEELRPAGAAVEEYEPETAGEQAHPPVQMIRAPQQLSTLERVIGVVRAALPIAQKVLPLIDGQVATVVSNFLAPQASPRPVAQPAAPLQEGLTQLEKQQVELRAQVAGQSAALQQIDEQLEAVKKLAEETTEEQRNLVENLEKMQRKMNRTAIAGLVLLVAVVVLNVVLLARIR